MKTLISIAVILFVLAGCGPSKMALRQAYIDAHPELDYDTREWIRNGKIAKGMTKEQVRASWGDPCWYCYGTRRASWGDSWEYNIFGTSRGIGTVVYFDSADRVRGWSN